MDIGSTYGQWTVIETPDDKSDLRVTCRCDCGTERRVFRHKLKAGQSRSCGCSRDEERDRRMAALARGKQWPNLAPERADAVEPGARFGRWTALTIPYSEPGDNNRKALCRCDCGAEKRVTAGHLLSGATRSCGCLKRDAGRAVRAG